VLAPVGAAAEPGEEAGVLGGVVGPITGPEVLGELGGVVGPVTGAEVPGVLAGEDAAELVEELQAVNRRAIHARDAQDAICRGLPAWVISMCPNPSIKQ
jgi:hypothetical protein